MANENKYGLEPLTFQPTVAQINKYGLEPLGTSLTGVQTNKYGLEPLQGPERGFFDKIAESFRRGNRGALARVGVYQALKNPEEDLQGALYTHKKIRRNEILDPIEGHFLSNLVYKSAGITGQLIESVKRAGVVGTAGAAVGAIGGAAVGAAIPSVGEEAPLIGAGAKLGFKLGAAEAAALFSYQEGVGGMYADMIEQGIDHKTADTVAHIAGIPYSLIEVLQLKTLTPNIKKGAQEIIQKGVMNVVGKFAKKYAGNLTKEVVEEMAQEVTQIVAEDTASYLSKHDVQVSEGYIEDRIKRVLNVAKEATQGFALLPIPGAAMETSLAAANSQINAEIEQAKNDANSKTQIRPEDLNSPVSKFTAAIQNSIDTYESQEEIRKKERGRRFAAGEEAIKTEAPKAAVVKRNSKQILRDLKIAQNKARELENKYAEEHGGFFKTATLYEESEVAKWDNEALVRLQELAVEHPEVYEKLYGKEKLQAILEERELMRQEMPERRIYEPTPAQPTKVETKTEGSWRQDFKRELKGEYTKLGIEPLQEVIPTEFYEALDQELKTTDKIKRMESVNLGDAIEKLYKEGTILRPHEIKYARKVWGDQFANTLEQLSDTVNNKGMTLADYLALPKVTSASMDLSRTLRQNVLLSVGKPGLWAKSMVNDIRLFASDEKVARTLENKLYIELSNAGDLINKTGLRINKWGKHVGYKEGAERFGSKLAKLVPGIARSERAYSVGGNLIRMQYLKEIAQRRKGMVTTDKQWADIGHVLDIITGEGDPKTFGTHAATLNAVFFAPRLLQARIRTIADLFNPNLSWVARKMLAYHVVSFIAGNMGILAMMSAVPGVEIEKDYRSTDFGKIKIGKQRLDFWGGYLPLVRFVLRMADPTIKTQSGRTIEGERADTIWSFLQSKLGPAPAFLLDLMRGQTFYGDYVGLEADSLSQQFYQRFTPFFIQDIADALQYQGLYAGMRAAPLAFFGAGVQTYPTSKTTEVLQQKNLLSEQVLGEKWDKLGPEIQDYLREEFPEIEQAERQASFDRSNFSFLEKIGDERDKTAQRMNKALPSDVRDELELLNLKPSGISRVISSDWYLNDKRYKMYEAKVTLAYKKVLTKLVRSSKWNMVPSPIKVKLLTEIMNEIKNAVRADIVADANKEDILRIQRTAGTLRK